MFKENLCLRPCPPQVGRVQSSPYLLTSPAATPAMTLAHNKATNGLVNALSLNLKS